VIHREIDCFNKKLTGLYTIESLDDLKPLLLLIGETGGNP